MAHQNINWNKDQLLQHYQNLLDNNTNNNDYDNYNDLSNGDNNYYDDYDNNIDGAEGINEDYNDINSNQNIINNYNTNIQNQEQQSPTTSPTTQEPSPPKQVQNVDDIQIKTKSLDFNALVEQELAKGNYEGAYPFGDDGMSNNKPKFEYKPRKKYNDKYKVSEPVETKKYKYYADNFKPKNKKNNTREEYDDFELGLNNNNNNINDKNKEQRGQSAKPGNIKKRIAPVVSESKMNKFVNRAKDKGLISNKNTNTATTSGFSNNFSNTYNSNNNNNTFNTNTNHSKQLNQNKTVSLGMNNNRQVFHNVQHSPIKESSPSTTSNANSNTYTDLWNQYNNNANTNYNYNQTLNKNANINKNISDKNNDNNMNINLNDIKTEDLENLSFEEIEALARKSAINNDYLGNIPLPEYHQENNQYDSTEPLCKEQIPPEDFISLSSHNDDQELYNIFHDNTTSSMLLKKETTCNMPPQPIQQKTSKTSTLPKKHPQIQSNFPSLKNKQPPSKQIINKTLPQQLKRAALQQSQNNEGKSTTNPNINDNNNDMLTFKINELQKNLDTLKKENEKVSQLKKEYEILNQRLKNEIEDYAQKKESDKIEFEKYKQVEMKKIEKERKTQLRNNKMIQNKKERDEIDSLKEQITKLQEELKMKDQKHKAAMDRMKRQLDEVTKKNELLQNEIKQYEEIRIQNMNGNHNNYHYNQSNINKEGKSPKINTVNTNSNIKNSKSSKSFIAKKTSAGSITSQETTTQSTTNTNINNKITPKQNNMSSYTNNTKDIMNNNVSFGNGPRKFNNNNNISTLKNSVQNNPIQNRQAYEIKVNTKHNNNLIYVKENNADIDSDNNQNNSNEYDEMQQDNENDNNNNDFDNENEVDIDADDFTLNNENNLMNDKQQILNVKSQSEKDSFNLVFLPKYHNKNITQMTLLNQEITQDGKIIKTYENNRKEVYFPSGLRKEIFPDGYQVSYFSNKDIKQIYPDGREVYLFAENKTVQTKLPNGLEVCRFANGQLEKNFPDGTKIVNYPDGTVRNLYPDGYEEIFFNDGSLQKKDKEGVLTIEYMDGIKDIIYPNGVSKRICPDGTVKFTNTAEGK